MDQRTAALLDVLRSLPAETLELQFRGKPRVYRGPSLFAYAAADLLSDDAEEALASGYFFVTAADEARAVVAVAEVAPMMSERRVILAIEQDGEPLRVGVRLVVPREGSRSLLGVTSVQLRDVRGESPARPAASTSVAVTSDERPARRIDVAGVPAEQMTTVVTVPGSSHGQATVSRTYTGVAVHHLLGQAGMFYMTDGEALSGKVIVATGADGHRAAVAAGEFGPQFMASPAIAATERDGLALHSSEGPVRLVVPYDRLSARWVQHLVALELREG